MFNQDLLRLIYGALALIFLSYPIRFLPSRKQRQIYSVLVGSLLQIYVFRWNMVVIYIQQIIVFAILRMNLKKCGAIITFEAMMYLSFYHIHQILYNYGGWTMDASALLMILVCKYSLLAYAIDDGKRKSEELSPEQFSNRLTKQITFFQFLGYTQFLPTALIGPPIEFNDYENFMQGKDPYKSTPSTLKIVGKTFLQTLLCASIYLFGQTFFPLGFMRTESFFEWSMLSIIGYSIASVTLIRFKYYLGWKLSMCSVHSSGVSFDGKEFKKINTCDPLVVQTSMHIRQKISHWNISVQDWLRKSIYQRSPFKNKMVSQLYVFMVSAFWHGFYLGYYFSFFLWFLQVYFQGLVFKYSQQQNTFMKKTYQKLGSLGYPLVSLLVSSLFCVNASFFLVLEGRLCLKLLESMHYIPQILFFGLVIFFSILTSKKNTSARQKKDN